MSFLTGSNAPQINYTPSGLTNPSGFNVSPTGTVSDSSGLTSNIGALSNTFMQGGAAYGQLASTVQPGFSQFRQAGLADIANTAASNMSTLKQNLAQRGIAGSSFANAQVSNANATFAQQQADFEASSYLQELSASFQLTQAQYQAQTQAYSTAINQSNIESATAAQLVSSNNQISASIASANAQLQAQSQAGAGSFLGSLLSLGAGLGGSLITSSALNNVASAIGNNSGNVMNTQLQ